MRYPDNIEFFCERCQLAADAAQVRANLGKCNRCLGESWTLQACFTDIWRETTAEDACATALFAPLTLPLSPLVGDLLVIPFSTKMKSTTGRSAGGVSAETALNLTTDPSLVEPRVLTYLRLREQQDFLDNGARFCQACGGLYIPSREKPWTMEGCCSKACASTCPPASAVNESASPQSSRLFKASCHHCGQRVSYEMEAKGQKMACPTCQNPFRLPGGESNLGVYQRDSGHASPHWNCFEPEGGLSFLRETDWDKGIRWLMFIAMSMFFAIQANWAWWPFPLICLFLLFLFYLTFFHL